MPQLQSVLCITIITIPPFGKLQSSAIVISGMTIFTYFVYLRL